MREIGAAIRQLALPVVAGLCDNMCPTFQWLLRNFRPRPKWGSLTEIALDCVDPKYVKMI